MYTGVPGGVNVFAPTGVHLGTIATNATANFVFGGSERGKLYMLQEGRVAALDTRARGVRLPGMAATGTGGGAR